MLTAMAKGRFHLPATHEESQDLLRGQRQVSGQQGLWVEFASAIANQHPANGHARQASVIPDSGESGNIQFMRPMVVPGQGQPLPEGVSVVDVLLWGGQAPTFLTRTTLGRIGRRRLVQ